MGHFDEAIDHLLKIEGGYVDHSYDRGGKTRYGITEAVAREYGYAGPMQHLPISVAKDIYRALYWDKLRLDQVAKIDPRVANELFDSAVNAGIGTVGKWYQRTLNVMRRGYLSDPLFPKLAVDGIVGGKTIAAHDVIQYDDRDNVLMLLNGLQMYHYFSIAERDVTQQLFIRGWLKRVEFSVS